MGIAALNALHPGPSLGYTERALSGNRARSEVEDLGVDTFPNVGCRDFQRMKEANLSVRRWPMWELE